MTDQNQRATTVRPKANTILLPLYDRSEKPAGVDAGEAEKEEVVVHEDDLSDAQVDKWDEVNAKVEELRDRVAGHFDDQNGANARDPVVIKAQLQPIREEMEQHQATHAPYAPWCKHCIAARAIRGQHPTKGRGAVIVVCERLEPVMYCHKLLFPCVSQWIMHVCAARLGLTLHAHNL